MWLANGYLPDLKPSKITKKLSLGFKGVLDLTINCYNWFCCLGLWKQKLHRLANTYVCPILSSYCANSGCFWKGRQLRERLEYMLPSGFLVYTLAKKCFIFLGGIHGGKKLLNAKPTWTSDVNSYFDIISLIICICNHRIFWGCFFNFSFQNG